MPKKVVIKLRLTPKAARVLHDEARREKRTVSAQVEHRLLARPA